MYIICCYDVASRRNKPVNKLCAAYLHPLQRSVFAGHITERQLMKFQIALAEVIDTEEDTITIFVAANAIHLARWQIGVVARGGTII